MGKYRDRLQIIADILSVMDSRSGGAKKTHVMYQANLSYALLSRYLTEVLDAGLVSLDDGNHYRLTTSGQTFLVRFYEYSKRCGQLEQHLNSVNDEKTVLENMINDNSARDRRSKGRLRNKKVT